MTITDVSSLLPIITKSELPPVDKARATALALNYPSQWENFDGNIVATEMELKVEMKNCNGWVLAGIIDTLAERDGEYIMIEHKTRSGDVDNVGDGYYRRLAHDMQITMYHILLECNGYPVEQTIYDVVRKLTTLCRRIPAGKMGDENVKVGSRAEMCKLGSYHGMDLDGKDLAWLAAYMEKLAVDDTLEPLKESPKLYGLRMAVAIAERPEKYFKQYGQIRRSYEEVEHALAGLRQVCQQIDATDPTDLAVWPMNTAQCNSYGTACEFMDVCAGVQDINGDQYQDRKQRSGPKELSHSKLCSYHGCKRKYHYRYNMGKEHVRQRAPALEFGSVMHLYFAAYFDMKKNG